MPSFPGSPRSIEVRSWDSLRSDEGNEYRQQIINFLHEDHELLAAAELGDVRTIRLVLSKGTNKQQRDYLGRNALHLAVCANSIEAIKILLDARVNPNIKDNVGMTPLSLCLMRRPSVVVAQLLFNYGAKILPRTNFTDTGLFLQFVMMCKPTEEEKKILELLLAKGAYLEDPDSPGGRQALHFAAMSNNCELIQILVDLGANLFVRNHRHQTPKEVAIAFKCREALYCLEDIEYSKLLHYRSNPHIMTAE